MIITNLGYDILHLMQEKLVIMPTYIISTIILLHRRGILENTLISKFE